MVVVRSPNSESDRELPNLCKSEWRDLHQRLQRYHFTELVAEIQGMSPRDLADINANRSDMLHGAYREIYGN